MIENVFVTYKCNWNCTYCITNTHAQKDVLFENILAQVNNIKPKTKVNFSGGEPGLLSEEKLKMLITILLKKQCKIRVFTNGEFFKHTNLLKYIDAFIYHCSENLLDDVIRISLKNVAYNIVISNSNYENLDSFLKRNKHIIFTLSGADSRDALSKVLGIRIWLKYKDIIQPVSKHYLLNSRFTIE